MANDDRRTQLPPPTRQPGPPTSVSQAEIAVPAQVARPLTIAVGVMVSLALLGMLLLWPDGAARAGADAAYDGVTFRSGTVLSLQENQCPGTTEDRLPDGTVPPTAVCVSATVNLGGEQLRIAVPAQVSRAGLEAGDRVRVARYPAQNGEPATNAWSGYDRSRPLIVLAVLFVAAIVLVARWRGLATLAGLLVSFPLLIVFVLPALREGGHAVPIALTSAIVMITLLMYIAHGPSVRTTVAWFGALGGVLITTFLGWVITGWADLDGLTTQDDFALGQLTSGAGLGNVVLAGIVIAGLGLLGDIAMAQVAAVWELRVVAPSLTAGRLFLRAMKIGRDNMASTFYTLVFAYLGASLPALLLIDVYGQPLTDVLIGGQVAEQLARVMIGGIGLVLAVPVTTLAAAVIASTARPVHPAGVSPETAMLFIPRRGAAPGGRHS